MVCQAEISAFIYEVSGSVDLWVVSLEGARVIGLHSVLDGEHTSSILICRKRKVWTRRNRYVFHANLGNLRFATFWWIAMEELHLEKGMFGFLLISE